MPHFLFEKIETLEDIGALTPVPNHIVDNLADAIVLRDYQERGLKYFLTYLNQDGLRKNRQIHTLFHMATGSGKTVMMAALILHLYTLGYRRFVFFVNQTTILEKTKSNFLDQGSSKHLFAKTIKINGKAVTVNGMSNFAGADEDSINICFTSVQKLHLDLISPSENGLSIDDFGDKKTVLISDEAHHINSLTKKLSKDEESGLRSWEYSVERAFREHAQNMLVEFTATANLNDPNILAKYQDKIVFDYPLAKFRASGYTKDFQNFQTDLPAWERSLFALVLSEYRRSLATAARQNIKPVVLMKSSKVAESEDFYAEFFKKLSNVSPDELMRIDSGEGIYHEAIEYFRARDTSLQQLIAAIKIGFSVDKSIIVNSRNQAETKETQLALNSLEDITNPYRLIFAVEMLNEGWDVLNLFDIVRLYDTRKSSSYTVKEAQLIGRGARYCPFVEFEGQDSSTRKYDNDVTNPYRLLETMFFHSVQDSRYITELRHALRDNGLLDPETYTVTYELKESFKETKFWREGLVFSNKRVEKPHTVEQGLPNRLRTNKATVKAANSSSSVVNLFGQMRVVGSAVQTCTHSRHFRELPLNVLLGTAAEFSSFGFNVLKSRFPGLSSVRQFMTSSAYLGDCSIDVVTPDGVEPTAPDWQRGIRVVLAEAANYILRMEKQYIGTDTFVARPIRSILRNKTLNLTTRQVDGVGTSQNMVSDPNLKLDLSLLDWYVFNDNFGTSEEKHFVRSLSSMVDQLRSKYDEVYLVRNERFAELAIFDFDTGERFEPDFLLFLREFNGSNVRQEQVYIEPKGGHLLEQDRWKERFLAKLASKSLPTTIYVDNNDYRITGLPMYSHEDPGQMARYTQTLKEIMA